MEEPYREKYTFSSTIWIIITLVIYIFLAFLFFITHTEKDHGIGIKVFGGVGIGFTIMAILAFVFKYRAVYMYSNRMVVTDIFNGVFFEVRYNNIARIGFLNATTGYYRNGSDIVDLAILLKDGGEVELYSSIVPNTYDIYVFIRERIS